MDKILVCLVMKDGPSSNRIREALEQAGPWAVCDAPTAGPGDDSKLCCPEVVVIDQTMFERLPLPLDRPERVVLLARKDRAQLERAWQSGIISVVWETDPTETIFLAIQAAALRCLKSVAPEIKTAFHRLN